MRFDLIIVGSGLAGASLAVALRNSQLRIALVDARVPQFGEGWDARLYALSPRSQQFLAAIGSWPHLDATRITPVYAMDIHGDAGGHLNLSAYDAGVPELAWIIEQNLMARELWETVKRQGNLDLFCPSASSALAIEPDGVRLTLADGRVLEASLIVGADGADSWVRQQAGLTARITPYGKRGVVANFRTERAHQGTAFQWFRADGVLAYLPLPGNMMSMVWSAPDDHAAHLMNLDSDELAREVAAAGAYRLGALDCLAPPQAFALRLIRVPQVVAPRVALIGDAAHAVHPLAGHGANLGFQDAATLGRLLGQLPAWRDAGEISVLREYARERAESVALMQAGTHALASLFASPHTTLSLLRNRGLSLINRLPPARNTLVRLALNI